MNAWLQSALDAAAGGAPWALAALAVATLVSEDLACIAAGLLVAKARSDSRLRPGRVLSESFPATCCSSGSAAVSAVARSGRRRYGGGFRSMLCGVPSAGSPGAAPV